MVLGVQHTVKELVFQYHLALQNAYTKFLTVEKWDSAYLLLYMGLTCLCMKKLVALYQHRIWPMLEYVKLTRKRSK